MRTGTFEYRNTTMRTAGDLNINVSTLIYTEIIKREIRIQINHIQIRLLSDS